MAASSAALPPDASRAPFSAQRLLRWGLALVPILIFVVIFASVSGGEFSGLTQRGIIDTILFVVPLLLLLVAGALGIQYLLFLFLDRVLKTRHAMPYTLLAPAVIALLLFMVYPLFFNVLLAFSNLRRETFPCYSAVLTRAPDLDCSVLYSPEYALRNFTEVFFRVRDGEIVRDENGNPEFGRLLRTRDSTFPILLVRTVVWTVVNVFFHVTVGMLLALIMNQKIRFKGIYRSLIVIPWAIPGIIVALTWRQEFHAQYGFVNTVIEALGGQGISWLDDPFWAFVAVIFVNVWLGIPFYMVMLLGGLQSISAEYYEAAQMDGASAWQRFWGITIPLLRPILIPAITLDVIWTFNKADLIFAMTGGGPSESTNILVTALYNAAFGPQATSEFGFASAFSIIIFIILFFFAIVWITTSGGLKEIYDR
jgi:arabinogalactan oligomer/maltooligosaccharide transport system permease protein